MSDGRSQCFGVVADWTVEEEVAIVGRGERVRPERPMATLPTTDERLASAIAILRTGGHEPEARAIEALVEEQVRTRSSDC